MASCIMHERVPACVYPRVWVCQREGRGFAFVPKTLHIGSHSDEMSDRAERFLGDWREGLERYVW